MAAVSAMAATVAVTVLGGPGAASAAAPAPEADVAYHGRVVLSDGVLGVWLVPENSGPAALPAATVRLTLSADLGRAEGLAEGCARIGHRSVVCETGALPARGAGRHVAVVLPLAVKAREVVVRIDTAWNGGAVDRVPGNNEHTVLALDTGDAYVF